jgi:hypothetical protein
VGAHGGRAAVSSIAQRGFESRRRQSVRSSFVLVVGMLALAAGGCGGDDDNDETASDSQGRSAPKLTDKTNVRGGQSRERAALQRVVGGMQKTTLTRIQIGPLDERRDANGKAAVPISIASESKSSTRRQWDEWIVAGAFSRRLQAEVDADGLTGSFTARPRLRGQPDPKPLTRAQEAAVVKAIRNAATRSGGKVMSLEVHRPYGAAVALSLSADDPARFLKQKLRPLMEKLDVQRTRLEGLYIAVLGDDRRLVLEWGSWTRNPAGSYWVRRDLANCSPIRQSEPPGAEKPPPCPV